MVIGPPASTVKAASPPRLVPLPPNARTLAAFAIVIGPDGAIASGSKPLEIRSADILHALRPDEVHAAGSTIRVAPAAVATI
jgi:hypothetical protein